MGARLDGDAAGGVDIGGIAELAALDDHLEPMARGQALGHRLHHGAGQGRIAAQQGAPGHDEVDLVGAIAQGLARILHGALDVLSPSGEVDHGGEADLRAA